MSPRLLAAGFAVQQGQALLLRQGRLQLMSGRMALVALAVSACRPGSSMVAEARADDGTSSASGVAVVELYTSEGCSSCPPADGVLATLEGQSASVYALEFHVDYWDDLGWPDPFSSADWTRRQQAYARSFEARSLYTPQMIVAGTDAFIGSDRARAEADIARSLARPAPVHISVHSRAADTDTVTVDFEALTSPPDATVSIAVVQHEAVTNVRAGENAGRTLRHVNIVRALAMARPPASTVTIRVPPSLNRSEGEVIAFVQEEGREGVGMPILGAARAPLPQ